MLEGFSSQRSYLNSDQVSYTVFYCSSYFSFCNFFVFIHVFVHFFFHVFWFPSVVASPPPFQCFLFCTLFYTPCKCTFLLTISWILHYITLHTFSKFYFFSSISIFQKYKILAVPHILSQSLGEYAATLKSKSCAIAYVHSGLKFFQPFTCKAIRKTKQEHMQ